MPRPPRNNASPEPYARRIAIELSNIPPRRSSEIEALSPRPTTGNISSLGSDETETNDQSLSYSTILEERTDWFPSTIDTLELQRLANTLSRHQSLARRLHGDRRSIISDLVSPLSRPPSYARRSFIDRTSAGSDIFSQISRRHSVAERLDDEETATGLALFAALADDDPRLQPDSKEFDLGVWLRRLMLMMQEKGVTPKQTGIAYRNLSVSGTGAALQVQDTLGTFFTAPLRLGELFSFGKTEPKRILQNFDGLINPGELLVVLGRPVSIPA